MYLIYSLCCDNYRPYQLVKDTRNGTKKRTFNTVSVNRDHFLSERTCFRNHSRVQTICIVTSFFRVYQCKDVVYAKIYLNLTRAGSFCYDFIFLHRSDLSAVWIGTKTTRFLFAACQIVISTSDLHKRK